MTIANPKIAASHYKSILAIDLVQEPKFKNLLSTVRKYSDEAEIVYAVGANNSSASLSLGEFHQMYEAQTEDTQTYFVRIPIHLLNFNPGQIRKIRPEFCIQNFNTFSQKVDFTQSEYGVVFFDENTNLFSVGKKQHTLTQCAAIAVVQENTEMTVLVRVIAFPPSVSKTKRDYVKSKVFYSEVRGINNTSESELLYHKVVYGEKDAILTKDFYESIEGFSWQPYEDEYSYVPNVQFVCTKVSQITKLVKMANANDLSEELRTIVQTLANAIDWEREAPKRELNSYLVRGLVNFEKWLRCLLDDEDIDFDLEDFITDFFSTKKQNKFLGSTSTDKKPWQQLVKVALRLNDRLMETKKIDKEFFSLRRKKFVNAIYNLANPNLDKPKASETVTVAQVKAYIKMVFGM